MRYLLLMAIPSIIFLMFWSGLERKQNSTTITAETADDSTSIIGKRVFLANCSTCHRDSSGLAAPGQTILSAMTPRAVLAALDNGKMRVQAAKLSDQEKKAVAQWVTNAKLGDNSFPKNAYTFFSPAISNPVFDHSGWGGNLEATGYRSAAQARISSANVSSLNLKWAFAFPDGTLTRSKPAIAGDWLIVGGQFGDVLALNRKTGKIGWRFEANAAIRGAIVVLKKTNSITAYFADFSTNVYAVDVKTGKLVWVKRAGYESLSSVTGSVAVYNGLVYVPITSLEVALAANGSYPCCVSSGGVVALNATTGNEIWRHRVITDVAKESVQKKNGKFFYGPSGAPVWCSPTVDAKRGLLYIGTGENYSKPTTNSSDAIQALDLKTGKLVWNFQATSNDAYNVACPMLTNCPDKDGPDLDFGMAPLLVKRKDGKELLVAGQKSGVVFALEPGTGKIIWQQRVGKGGALGGIHWGMAADGNNVYAAVADNIYAIDKRDTSIKPSPGLYALNLVTGKLVWKTPSPVWRVPANSAAPTVIPGIVFAGTLDGHIRAYASSDGKILWDFDTARDYETANGIKGKGGSIDGPAPVIADGMLFMNSGYSMFGEMPGNVLLAFEVEPKK
jgi:polyvinyl alcohol dehydrogenase (cytochrome)